MDLVLPPSRPRRAPVCHQWPVSDQGSGETIRVASVLGLKLKMKSGLFPKSSFDESRSDRCRDLEELRFGKPRMRFMLETDPAKTVADAEEIVLAIGHSPAVYQKANGLGGDAARICLVTTGIERIVIFWIKG
ncbi:MAG: hypothetical protein ACKOB1_03125 [Planctomycetia bacterium]